MNKIKSSYNTICILWLLFSCNSPTASGPPGYTHQVDSLMALMTLEEKLGQLNLPSAGDINTGLAQSTGVVQKIKKGQVGGLFNIRGVEKVRAAQKVAVEESRLGIPLVFAMDVIHGYRTVFPIPLGLSCSWDRALIERTARIAAQEATADGIAWTFSPMTDVSRDPRWGRISEGSGEDAYLGSAIAAAMVRGYQGDDLSANNTMMSCVKHFALYGAAEAGRDYGTVDMSRQRMYNEYMQPYKAAVDAGVGSVMSSFNEIDGVPATGNKWLLTNLLREEWNFDGFVVSDYTGVTEMTEHGVGDTTAVAALALLAGNDMDMVSEAFISKLGEALEKGIITQEAIDRACRRILEAKFKLGLFEDPYRYCDINRSILEIFTQANRDVARKIAAETFVLLKNEGDVLPLKKAGTIALIGPMADNGRNMQGTWSVSGNHEATPSLLECMMETVGEDVKILTAKGSNFVEDPSLESRISVFGKDTKRDDRSESELIAEALQVASRADVIVAAMGEASESSGESSSVTSIEMPENQRRLMEALLSTGKPVVLVLFTGRPLALKWEQENLPAILNVWFAGSEGGYAITDVLFGDVNPSGKLSTTFPQNTGQIPIFYNSKNTGRPLPEGKWFQKFKSNYLDVSNAPLYPFGYGLSYTSFEYGPVKVSKSNLHGEESLAVSVTVTNVGDIAGKEVIQLYIRDLVGTVTRPVKELKGFQKVAFQPGETQTIVFEVTTEDLKFYNYDLEHVWEAGDFEIMIGGNSRDVQTAKINWSK
ncbi:MAG: beta-glucosidase BglX [Cytophagales bacterium]|nr:beta-glucosidase BglX [Cytophagales bacterium]